MLKKLLCLTLMLCLCAAFAVAEEGGPTFTLAFDEGFTLALPEGWVSYPVEDSTIRYALGDGSGERFLYILAEPTALQTFEEVQSALESGGNIGKTSALDLNGQPFAAFIAQNLNASGCATLLNGETLTFLFTPQSDSEYMLTVARIMASFRLK